MISGFSRFEIGLKKSISSVKNGLSFHHAGHSRLFFFSQKFGETSRSARPSDVDLEIEISFRITRFDDSVGHKVVT